jgi:YbgC/YbaW family acyl-CoA thioester hydrolase
MKIPFRFCERLRVRWSEVDPQREVFAATYLVYADLAIRGYWRALGLPCSTTLKPLGGVFTVRKMTVEYEAPARFDDVLDIGIRCTHVDHAAIQFKAQVLRQNELLVQAELVQVLVCNETGTIKPIPANLRELLLGFETGQSAVKVSTGSWSELGADARYIRTNVFIMEQGIPEKMEWDNVDPSCIHAVAYNRFGVPLATGRLIEHVPGVAKIGRMAVSQAARGSGVGRAVLDALMQFARERGYREAVLHAQVSAMPFYSRSGFVARGPVFDDVSIPHIEMVCAL